MEKKLLLLLIMSLLINGIYSQNFDGYKYFYSPTLTYQNGQIDIFRLSNTLKLKFKDKGFNVLSDNVNQNPKEATLNNCLILFCYINHSGGVNIFDPFKVELVFKNCKDEIIFLKTGTAFNGYLSAQKNLENALNKCLYEINKMSYSFNNEHTPKLDYPDVEETSENEETLKHYLTSNSIDPIEGIYKSYQDETLAYYKFGIIKKGDVYKAIIIESDYKHWKAGEVKAVFEQSSMKGFYSVKWYMANKKPIETFGMIENEAILSIELQNANGEKTQDKFIKMFPSATTDYSLNKDFPRASGSGFFLTENGIIATNAHVIEGASNIEITTSNEIGNFTYKTKVLLKDTKNDVALIQIDDEKFKGFNSIPYGIEENSEIGTNVFTIGFPLNDVMGNNYKVTNGIISSKSGVADDIRYYQITVPLQLGNSGGPLFNKDGNLIGITSAKLSSAAVGTQIENVNYAIKLSYLLNLYNMLPNASKLSTVSSVSDKELQDQVKILKNYVCLIKVF